MGRQVAKAMEQVRLPVAELVDNPRNPRQHTTQQIDMLAASLRKFGQTKPVLARKANRMLIAGHGLKEAAKLAGLQDLDVILWDVDEVTADTYMLADNRLGDLSHDDHDQVVAILRDLAIDDPEALGYTDDELEKILAESLVEYDVVEIETAPVKDRFWITVRGPLPQQAKALQQLKSAMANLEDVEVDLGTVAG